MTMTFKDLKIGDRFSFSNSPGHLIFLIKISHVRNMDKFQIEEYNSVNTDNGAMYWFEEREHINV